MAVHYLLSLLLLLVYPCTLVFADPVDLTTANRRPAIHGLPDWTRAGFEEGARGLPTDADIGQTIGPDELAQLGVIPDDGQDDTAALQEALDTLVPYGDGKYTLVILPPGVINLSAAIWLEKSYMILRGSGDHETQIVMAPSETTKYDVLTSDGSQWDIDNMKFSWSYNDGSGGSGGVGSGAHFEEGTASSGWIWPGRSMFRVGSQGIAPKFATPYDMAPDNRKDFFKGTVNYHWRNDKGAVKGFMALQTLSKPGLQGQNKVYVDPSTDYAIWENARDVWIASPVKYNDYKQWGVTTDSYYVNSYVFQDWHTVTGIGNDTTGTYLTLDRALRFDVYANSVADGSPVMEKAISYAKVMPVDFPADHIGIENLYMTQPMSDLNVADAKDNYGNMAPESAMHGVVFRYAKNCWVRKIHTYMTGSHPIATEAAKNIQVQDNYFDGAWNKGKGGNGYLRGSRVWDSVYYNNTLQNLRHFTFQWCAMGNVAIMNNVTNDFNMHGGYEGFNLIELNYAQVSYNHRSGSCLANCGGEGGDVSEAGTWWPIYWSTGEKASKWSGATGPQNVFYRNYMIKQATPGAAYDEYRPYFARDGSLSQWIWQFGWDALTEYGEAYQHLTLDDSTLAGVGILVDWQGNEQVDYTQSPNAGVNGRRSDPYTSLFLRDVTAADSGVTTYSEIAGYAYCRGNYTPKVVGYYLSASETYACAPLPIEDIDYTAYTHILFSYAQLGTDGTLTLTGSQPDQLSRLVNLKSKDSKLKIFLAVGGWGLGANAANLRAVATSGSFRTKLANSAKALCAQYHLDGIDLEWAPGITAAQFTTITTTIKTALGTSLSISLSTPRDFWQLTGTNVVTIPLAANIEFLSLITHNDTSSVILSPNAFDNIANDLQVIQTAGLPPNLVLAGVPFYGRSRKVDPSCGDRGCTVLGKGQGSTCLPSSLGTDIIPFYELEYYLKSAGDPADDPASTSLTWSDPYIYTRMLLLSDGSYIEYDDPPALNYKTGLAIQYCMGGLSIFSIDMDNTALDLTYSMWETGGLIPEASDIALSIFNSNNPLTDQGFVSEEFWDSATNRLASTYPWLTMESVYKVLTEIAMNVQLAVVQRLKNLLFNSALSQDSFQLYQKWETKSTNWIIANATGYGHQFWSCSYNANADASDYASDKCPGGFEQDSTPKNDVYWRLDDYNGFQNYLNQTIGITLDDLIVGDIEVNKDLKYCQTTGAGPKRRSRHRQRGQHTSQLSHPSHPSHPRRTASTNNATRPDPPVNGTDDGTGRVRNWDLENSLSTSLSTSTNKRDAPDPYDPDPSCEMLWHSILLVNSTAWFQPPTNSLNGFFALAESNTNLGQAYTDDPYVTQSQLIQILQSFVNAIAIGNSSIGSTLSYISEVQYDQQLQKQFDQATARASALSIFLDIGLAILGFIPGIGDAVIIGRAVEIIESVADVAKAARLSKLLDEDSALGRLFANGIKGSDEVAEAADETEAALEPETLATREKTGGKIDNNNKKCSECGRGEDSDWFMDAVDLGTQFIPSDPSDPSSSIAERAYIRRRRMELASTRPSWPRRANSTGRAISGLNQVLSRDLAAPRGLVSIEEDASDVLVARAKGRAAPYPKRNAQLKKCIFTMANSDSLKGNDVNGKDYKTHCQGINFEYQKDAGGSWLTGTIKDCYAAQTRPKSSACQCDHIFEADEILPIFLQLAGGAEKKDLGKTADTVVKEAAYDLGQGICDELPGLTNAIMQALNDATNMSPLYEKINNAKNKFLTAGILDTSAKVISSKSGDADVASRLKTYMFDNEQRRIDVARAIDAAVDKQISDAGLTDHEFFKSIYQQNLMDLSRQVGDHQYSTKMGWVDAANPPADPVDDPDESQDHASPSQDDPDACGGKKDVLMGGT